MRVLGLVPARGGSRRLERKNLAEVGGRTLVRRALDTAVASGALAAVALSSDDEDILAEAAGVDEIAAIARPPELATDTAGAYDVVAHALGELEADASGRFDAVAVVQATSPFTLPDDVRGAVELLERSGAPSVVTVTPADHALHPLKLKRMEEDRLLPFLEDDRMRPAHELPELWVRNGAVYASTREVIDGGRLVADDVLGYRMPRERSIDVNDALDLEFARFLAQRERR